MIPSDWFVVEQLLAGKLAVKDVHEADRDAAIVHLRAVDGMSAMEIAHRLKVNHATSRRVLREWEAREARRAMRRAG